MPPRKKVSTTEQETPRYVRYELVGGKRNPATIIEGEFSALVDDGTGKKKRKVVRYVESINEIFKDEQPNDVVVSPIVIEDGILDIDTVTQDNLLRVMELHPSNEANGGSGVYKKDPDAIAKKSNAKNRLIANGTSVLLDKLSTPEGVEEIRTIAISLGLQADFMSVDTLEFELTELIKREPEAFLDMLDNPDVVLKSLAVRANALGILDFTDEYSIKLQGRKTALCSRSPASTHVDSIVGFMKLEEGSHIKELLETEIARREK